MAYGKYSKKPIKYYKKKRYVKRAYKKRNMKRYRRKAPMIRSIGMPNSLFMKLKYTETFVHLTGALGV